MSPLAELNLGRRRRLPVIMATEAAECGLACMAMVARLHGHDIDLNGLGVQSRILMVHHRS